MNRRIPIALIPLAALATTVVIAGCSSTTGHTIAVTATDSACEVAETTLDPGSLVFAVTNKGNDVTEVYVYAEEDRVVGEVENIGPGTSRDLTVELDPGDYEVACKPGQKGDGIRTPIVVRGTPAPVDTTPPDETVTFAAHDNFTYSGLDDFSPTDGERVEFEMHNAGPSLDHEFELSGPDGEVLGEIGPTAAGKTGKVTFTLDQAGTYTYICGIDDHAEQGMKGTFTVSA